MKKAMKIILVLAIILVALNSKDMHDNKNDIKRISNPNLPVLKERWAGNIIIDGKFFNDSIVEKAPTWDVVKWKLSRNPQKEEKKNDTFQLQVVPLNGFSKHTNSIIWLGHSSFLINIGGISMITDPCFFNLPSGKRKTPLPCMVDSLKSIDYVLISHDHRDHFDKKSVESLAGNNPDIEALIPLNGSRLFKGKKLSNIKRQEAGWYQEYNLADSIRIVFLPAKHWGRRGLNDFNKTLWGSFLIIKDNLKIFFAGDTAYDETLFKEINNLFGDIDVCMIPIAAYSPQFLMKHEHVNPEEAVQIFQDLSGKCFIPMHYGTYDLSDEPLSEPIKRLKKLAEKNGCRTQIKKMDVGEVFFINQK
jgi:L-ascorbate metabolism protein UlaG (beta-lactamase superfamily)